MALASVIFITVFGLVGASVARFPDAFFRLGVRVYLSNRIIGNISSWVAVDFLRVTLIAMVSGYFCREFLIRWRGNQNLFKDPVSVVLITIFTVALFVATYRIEGWIIGNRRTKSAISSREADR